MAAGETAYEDYSKLITKLIKALQSYDTVVEQVKKGEILNKHLAKAREWQFDEQRLLRCN